MAASARRTAITVLSATIAAVLAAAAIGCGIAALWIFAAPRIGPSGAALAAALCLLVLSLGVLGIVPMITRRTPTVPRSIQRPLTAAASPELLLLAEATRLFKDHKSTVLVAALVAGLLAGNDSRER